MTHYSSPLNLFKVALLWALCMTHPIHAQPNQSMAQAPQAASTEWTTGEIRKLDKDTGKLSIRHEDIKSLNMPAMTMVFMVNNKALLEGFKVGDKIQFIVVQEQGKLIVTQLQLATVPQ